jgi:DNA ligase-1
MFVSPMLLKRVDEPFDSDDYISELKFDGIRLLLTKFNNEIHLYTRHNNDVTAMFPEIYEGLNIPDGTILDGEIIVPGENGAPDFESMMSRFRSSKGGHFVQFCVFDVIYYKNENISSLPLMKRKELLLHELTFTNNHVVPVQWIEGNGKLYFNLIKERNLEGIVLKRKDSKYHINKRSDEWLKVINYKFQDVAITGMLKKDHSFLLSSLDSGQNIGVMEFIPPQERKKVYSQLNKSGVNESDNVIYFNQTIPCNIKFRNWTSNGKLRIPSFHKWIS